MNLRDRNLRFALLKAIADAVAEELANERAGHTADLLERYDDEGTKGFDVKLPDGTKVATITLSVPKAPGVTVDDEEAFKAWCVANMPTAVDVIPMGGSEAWDEVIHHPATQPYTLTVLDSTMVAALLKGARYVKGVGVVDEAGQLIDGVTYQGPGRPKSFSVRYEDGGREALAEAYRDGEVNHLLGGSTLPQLGA